MAVFLRYGNQAAVIKNTLTEQGDCLVYAVCEGECSRTESVRLRNSIFHSTLTCFPAARRSTRVPPWGLQYVITRASRVPRVLISGLTSGDQTHRLSLCLIS
jgi:hypothetical protein